MFMSQNRKPNEKRIMNIVKREECTKKNKLIGKKTNHQRGMELDVIRQVTVTLNVN